ncbi:FecCD family ABC transporter permease [Reinekea blandensis]|uniref:Iron (III) dicitrate transport system (Permease) n=1 Tax=Reinekea blandensis MED297 TaxID=314283 RepID=A4BJ29_9GAMM|nr:iron ABC transporter permease [Reinekea blandensis]EAR07874.1 iron (III) dicitrate transport system (permease) [Reinekea sp. MED297] [Reinekea blandensis MED297]
MVSTKPLLLGLILLVFSAFWMSLSFGQTRISQQDLWQAFTAFDATSVEHTVVRINRLSRAATALVIGAALAVAGVLSQTLTRNALASPGLLGINAGALMFIAIGFTWLNLSSLLGYMLLGFLGATVATALVYLLAWQRGLLSPLRIILAGAACGAMFTALTQGILIADQATLSGLVYWLGGSVAGRSLEAVGAFAPWVLVVTILVWLSSRLLNLLLLDDETAAGLGQSVNRVRPMAGLAVIVLAGGSVAVAGLIGFIGLIVPHAARRLVGTDHRRLVPVSALIGGLLLLLADTLSRFIIPPQEMPIGVMTAAIGIPVFLVLVTRRQVAL